MSKVKIRKLLLLYDIVIYIMVILLMLILHPSEDYAFSNDVVLVNSLIGFLCIFGARFALDVYRQIWRYGIMHAYIKLLFADIIGGILFIVISKVLPGDKLTFIRLLSIVSLNLLGSIAIRMLYYYFYQTA